LGALVIDTNTLPFDSIVLGVLLTLINLSVITLAGVMGLK
jgi:hypothetical protein